jgi:hypothetical protein
MRLALRAFVLATVVLVPCVAAEPARIHFLTFPRADIEVLGQIDKLNVIVDCSWIASLKGVPELYNIEIGYDMPTQNLLEARPRLGAAAVTLAQWTGVVGVRIPPDADAKSCFTVTVTAEGREGVVRTWKGRQLGLPK